MAIQQNVRRDLATKKWVWRALSDLFFSFSIEEPLFEDHSVFAAIMGMEKMLKSVILASESGQFENLPEKEANAKIDKLARKIGHDFAAMLEGAKRVGVLDISTILVTNFDGYDGNKLVAAVSAGYNELRYPVPNSISVRFPIKGAPGFFEDPLGSSGIVRFIYAVCNACFRHLARFTDFSDLLRQFADRYSADESFERFNNSFWERAAVKSAVNIVNVDDCPTVC